MGTYLAVVFAWDGPGDGQGRAEEQTTLQRALMLGIHILMENTSMSLCGVSRPSLARLRARQWEATLPGAVTAMVANLAKPTPESQR